MPQISTEWITENAAGDTAIVITVPMSQALAVRDQLAAATGQAEEADELYRISVMFSTEYQDYHRQRATELVAGERMPGDTTTETDELLMIAMRVGYLRAHGIPATIDTERNL